MESMGSDAVLGVVESGDEGRGLVRFSLLEEAEGGRSRVSAVVSMVADVLRGVVLAGLANVAGVLPFAFEGGTAFFFMTFGLLASVRDSSRPFCLGGLPLDLSPAGAVGGVSLLVAPLDLLFLGILGR